MEMLNVYGIKLNHTLQEMLKTYVVLPGDDSLVHTNDIQQTLSQGHHQFDIEPEMCLLLKQSVTSKILVKLFIELEEFIKPIFSKLEFFVYFHLHDCEIFSKYLNYQLAIISSSECSVKDSQVILATSPTDSQKSFLESDKKIEQVHI